MTAEKDNLTFEDFWGGTARCVVPEGWYHLVPYQSGEGCSVKFSDDVNRLWSKSCASIAEAEAACAEHYLTVKKDA